VVGRSDRGCMVPNSGGLRSRARARWPRLRHRLINASRAFGYSPRMNERMLMVGASASVLHTVTEADIARTLGTGDVPVLASSRLLTWAEGATCAAVDADLDASQTSVGTGLELQHMPPSPLDATVLVRAELTRVDGRVLMFEVQAEHDDGVLVGRGEVSRIVVDRQRFLERAAPGD
jgi:fluoroacetyl-CoA thioesterase